MRKKKIGLALGGGGARGLAHIGVLKVLEEEGIKIDVISGSSMGAFIAGYYALGLPIDELEEEMISFNKRKAIKTFVDLAAPGMAILKGKKGKKYIDKFIKKNKVFSDTKIPLGVICTDLASGDEVVIKKGNMGNAILASMSVPGIFPPVKIGGRYMIDGGIVNPTPIDTIENMGADIIIGVDLIMKREIKLDNPSLISTLIHSYEIIRSQAIKFNLRKVNGKTILIKPNVRGTIDSFKLYNMDKFIASGEEAARKALPEIRKQMNA